MSSIESLKEVVAEHRDNLTKIVNDGASDDLTRVTQTLDIAQKAILEVASITTIKKLVKESAGSLVIPPSDLWVPEQGYVGLINEEGEPSLVSASGNLKPGDQIVEASGNPKTPLMGIVKALRGTLIPSDLTPEETSVRYGLTMGFGRFGETLVGATCFMPTDKASGIMQRVPEGASHLQEEATTVFRGSGALDQFAVNTAAGQTTETFTDFANRDPRACPWYLGPGGPRYN